MFAFLGFGKAKKPAEKPKRASAQTQVQEMDATIPKSSFDWDPPRRANTVNALITKHFIIPGVSSEKPPARRTVSLQLQPKGSLKRTASNRLLKSPLRKLVTNTRERTSMESSLLRSSRDDWGVSSGPTRVRTVKYEDLNPDTEPPEIG